MAKLGNILAILLIVSAFSFSAIWEMKCSDGTAYSQCSQASPGYYCGQASADTVELQKVVGEVNPAGHPKVGEPTTLAVKCACSNFAGYIEKDGECVDQTKQKPVEAPKTTQKNETTAVKNETQNTTQETAQTEQKETVPEQTQALEVPKETIKQETTNKGWDSGQIIIAMVVLSVVGAGGLFVLVAIAILVYYKFRKKKGM
ncbi:MAG: hypothetical protein WC492_02600 [Candidatus Micrarchaeia archaeon]